MAELGVWIILNTSQPLCVNEILRSQYKKRHSWKVVQKNVQALLSERSQSRTRSVRPPRGWGFCPKVSGRAPAPGAHSGLQREAQKEEGVNARRTAVGGKVRKCKKKGHQAFCQDGKCWFSPGARLGGGFQGMLYSLCRELYEQKTQNQNPEELKRGGSRQMRVS